MRIAVRAPRPEHRSAFSVFAALCIAAFALGTHAFDATALADVGPAAPPSSAPATRTLTPVDGRTLIRFEPEELDLGTVRFGEFTAGSVRVHNISDRPVRIVRVIPPGSSTVDRAPKEPIPVGGSVEIPVGIYGGPTQDVELAKRWTFQLEGGTLAMYTIKAHVGLWIDIEPDPVVIDPDDPERLRVLLSSMDGVPFRVLRDDPPVATCASSESRLQHEVVIDPASIDLGKAAIFVTVLLDHPAVVNLPILVQRRAIGAAAPMRLCELPAARQGPRAEWIGGAETEPGSVTEQVVVFGGFAADSHDADRGTRETWVLARPPDPSTAPAPAVATPTRWRRVGDLPVGRAFFGSAIVDGSIFAIGGSIDRYDASKEEWKTIAPVDSFPDSHFGAAALGGRLYALGGFPARSGGFIGFDVATSTLLDPPEPPGFAPGDHFHIVAALNDELHVIGGLDHRTFTPTSKHWAFDGATWRAAAPPPRPLWAKFAAVQRVGNCLYVFDGDCGLRYNACDDSWTPVRSFAERVVMPTSVANRGTIFVIGGEIAEDGGSASSSLRTYSIAHDRWSVATPPKRLPAEEGGLVQPAK